MTCNPPFADCSSRLGCPPLVEAEDLARFLSSTQDSVKLVDLSAGEDPTAAKVPGAMTLDFGSLVRELPPVSGLLPADAELQQTLGALDLCVDSWVIAFDEGNSLKATRLLWTLWACGFRRLSLLNGGLGAWSRSGAATRALGLSLPAADTARARFTLSQARVGVMDTEDILAALDRPGFVAVDCRSAAEYRGDDLRSARGGHIPRALHLDWRELLQADGRLLPEPELRARVEAAGLHPDQELVTYCQTHRRSCVVWWVLVALGFPRVSGYPGSWSDWGNRFDTPAETGTAV